MSVVLEEFFPIQAAQFKGFGRVNESYSTASRISYINTYPEHIQKISKTTLLVVRGNILEITIKQNDDYSIRVFT